MLTLYKYQIIETAVVFVLFATIKMITRFAVHRARKKYDFNIGREKITVRIINVLLLVILTLAIAGIWGLEKRELLAFLASILAVVGVAFFAQWSILSNITSGLILFFTHPLKLGDYIKVLEKDGAQEGWVEDISFFFLHIRGENGDRFTIPNSVILQKAISVVKNPEKEYPRSERDTHEI